MPKLPFTQKTFTSSELVLLQKLYRSRNFQVKIDPQQGKNETRFLVYGSINALSSEQRAAFRQYVAKINPLFTKIKRSLFASSVSKTVIGFSSLTSLKNIFKGTTYELEISFCNSDKISVYEMRISCLDQLLKLRFNDDSTFNFTPSLIIVVGSDGQISPMRYADQKKLLTANSGLKIAIRQQVVYQIESTYNQII